MGRGYRTTHCAGQDHRVQRDAWGARDPIGAGPGPRHRWKRRSPGPSMTRTAASCPRRSLGPQPRPVRDPDHPGSRPRLEARPPLHECVSFPGPLPGARQENPQVDGLHMTHRRAGDAARVGEPDDRSHLRGGHGSKGVRGRRPGEGGASSRAWEPGGRAPRRRRPAGRDTGPRPAGRAPHPHHRNRRKSHARPAEMTFDSMHPAAGRRATSPPTEDHSETAGITLFGAMGMRGSGADRNGPLENVPGTT